MTDFAPTPEQAEALASMKTWLSAGYDFPLPAKYSGSPFFCLRGYAGTGKSYSITLLAKSGLFPPEKICFTAPTNKAVKVLRNYLDSAGLQACPTRTIYSLLGLSLQPNGEVKEITKPEEPVDLSGFKLIVVDEGSMINRFLVDAVKDAFDDWNVPFLFMGDPAQLPPVGETTSPIWKIEPYSELTTVMRYGGPLLDLATSIRKVVDAPFPSIKIETDPPLYRHLKGDWINSALENLDLFREGEAKIIAWRNVKVDEYNRLIRENLFDRQTARLNVWLPTDKIVATAHLKNLDDEIFMKTDEEATVLEVSIGSHPKFREFEIFSLLCLDELDKKVTIRTLTPDGQFHLNNRLNELSAEARGGKKYKWREFWQLKEAFNEIRHSYAITAHRSQGSSYRKVWVDLEDILLNRNRQEAFRALYVACSRQREELHVA